MIFYICHNRIPVSRGTFFRFKIEFEIEFRCRDNTGDPEEFGGMRFEHLNLLTNDGVMVHGWFIKTGKDDSEVARVPTVIYFHGNAGNISNRLPFYHELWEKLHVNIIAAEYRGFGASEGTPSEAGLKQDAQAFLDFAWGNDSIDRSKIFLFGRSLGGAVAVDAAVTAERRDVKIRGVILENTFLSVADIAVVLYPFLGLFRPILQSPVLKSVWGTKDIINRLHVPILFISGEQDQLIPCTHMKQLFVLCRRVRGTQFCSIPNGTHNDTPVHGGQQYYDFIGRFFIDASEFHDERRDSRGVSDASIDSIVSEYDDRFFH